MWDRFPGILVINRQISF